MEENSIKKVVVIGPESTGKSTLCAKLAAHYQTVWVREYAREYLEKNGSSYKFEDLYKIAEGQLALEYAAIANHELRITNDQNFKFKIQNLFFDTDLHVIKIWSEFVFDKIDNRILTKIAEQKYDLYLLCDIDLPWVKDGLREYPDRKIREKLFHYYKEELTEQDAPWVVIKGNSEERLTEAIKAVHNFNERLKN